MFGYLLVVAGSARMLVQAAVRAGFKPLAIDLYADADTQEYAVAVRRAPSLALDDLVLAVAAVIADYPVSAVVYGSGFEYYPESLRYLADKLTVWGNSPEVFTSLQNKPYFFATLHSLAIPYPKISFNAPENNGQWLQKPTQGQGGLGVKFYTGVKTTDLSCYWQKYQPGRPHSVLFLADGERAEIIGFNRQWTINLGEGRNFAFAGMINQTDLSASQQAMIKVWLFGLVPQFGLKGLNSLDFIVDGGQIWVLEINPRVSASMQLYGGGLLARHIQACNGDLLDYCRISGCYSGYQIVYAHQDVRIPAGFHWPEGSMDLPAAGVICRKGQPICSIIAHHKQAAAVLKQLEQRQQTIFKQLQTGSDSHGIPS